MDFPDYPIIDAHIHPFISKENSICFFLPELTCEGFFAEQRKVGIAKSCGSVLHRGPTTWDDILNMNRQALKLQELYPDDYIPGIHVHGDFPEESCQELEYMKREHGVMWVGELVAYMMHNGPYDSPGMYKIYDAIQSLDMVVNIHCSDLPLIENILKNFPKLKFVLAHPEDTSNAQARFDLISRYPNAHIDISGTGLFRWGMLRYAIDICGSEKILFGSDFPICSPGMNLGGTLAEHLTPTERKNVLHDNFMRLITP